uniref:EGF-like domain-containing protein n=1 Tax=Ciona savignyi TaxID=51511 RepID=H2ZAX3_CIOSA
MLTTGVRQKDNVTETGIWDSMSENNEPVNEFSAMGSGMEVGFCLNGDICYNGGTCETVIEESRCLCPVGYTGRDCSYHLEESPCFDCHQDSIESYRSPRSLENYEVVQMEWKHGANHTGGHILAAQLISVMLEEKRHHNIALASLGGFILILIALFVGYFLSKFIARRNDRRLDEEIYIV